MKKKKNFYSNSLFFQGFFQRVFFSIFPGKFITSFTTIPSETLPKVCSDISFEISEIPSQICLANPREVFRKFH